MRVALFSLTACVLAGALGASSACSSPARGNETTTFDAAPPPLPGPCVVTTSALPACEAGVQPEAVDAGDVDAQASDASLDAADASGPLAPPASENRCLVTEDVSIACPSAVSFQAVAASSNGASDVLVTQRGLGYYADPQRPALTNDQNAYLQMVHVDANGAGKITMNPIAPYAAASMPQNGVALLPGAGARDAALVSFTGPAEGIAGMTSVRVGTHPAFQVPTTNVLDLFTSQSGEGFLVVRPQGAIDDGPLVLVRGLPDAPRTINASVGGGHLLVSTTDRAGTPAGLFADAALRNFHLYEGETFANERWSRTGIFGGALDLVYVDAPSGAVPAVLLGGGDDAETTVHVIRSADSNAPYGVLGKSYSTCSRSTYLGITCDACPVSESCETGQDQIRTARLFTRQGRLFAAYYSTDIRTRMAYVLDTTIIGLGCVCSLVDREKTEFADSLVVVEIVPPTDAITAPTIIERMRVPLYKAHTTGSVQLAPRADGDLDVLLGPSVVGFDQVLTRLPEQPTPLRMLRVSTKSIP